MKLGTDMTVDRVNLSVRLDEVSVSRDSVIDLLEEFVNVALAAPSNFKAKPIMSRVRNDKRFLMASLVAGASEKSR